MAKILISFILFLHTITGFTQIIANDLKLEYRIDPEGYSYFVEYSSLYGGCR